MIFNFTMILYIYRKSMKIICPLIKTANSHIHFIFFPWFLRKWPLTWTSVFINAIFYFNVIADIVYTT